jgi:hypothetical protein
MGFTGTATASGGDIYTPPAGNHPARMVAALDLGWHEEVYRNQKTHSERRYWRNRGLFGWQLFITPSGVIFKEFTLTAYGPKAGLRFLMEKLRGKPYPEGDSIDPLKMLGQPCLVSIIHQTSARGMATPKSTTLTRYLPA